MRTTPALCAALLLLSIPPTGSASPHPQTTGIPGKPSLVVQVGHTANVETAAFSPDGTLALTSGGSGRVVLWNASTGAELRRLTVRGQGATSFAFSADGARFAVVHGESGASVWETATGAPAGGFALEKSDEKLRDIALSGDLRYAASVGERNVTRIHDLTTGAELWKQEITDAEVERVELSPDGVRLLMATGDGRALVVIASESVPSPPPLSVDGSIVGLSPRGTYLLASVRDGSQEENTLVVYDTTTLREVRRLPSDAPSRARVSPDERLLFTVAPKAQKTAGGLFALTEIATWKERLRFGSAADLDQYESTPSIEFSPDGSQIRMGGEVVEVWDTSTGKRRSRANVAKLTTGMPGNVTFSPDGSRAILLRQGGMQSNPVTEAPIVDTATGTITIRLKGLADRLYLTAISEDGSRFVTATASGRAHVWSLEAGSQERAFRWRPAADAETESFSEELFYDVALAMSADGRVLFAGRSHRRPGTPSLVDLRTGLTLTSLRRDPEADQTAQEAALSRDGSRLALVQGVASFELKLIELPGGRVLLNLPVDAGERTARLRLSADERKILLIDGEGVVEVDVETKAIRRVALPPRVYSSFSQDGSLAISGGEDSNVRVTRVADGREIARFAMPGKPVSVAVSPDGRAAVTTGADGTARLWALDTGKQLWEWSNPEWNTDASRGFEITASFSPLGRYVTVQWNQGGYAVLDARTGQTAIKADEESRRILFLRDEARALTEAEDGSIRLWYLPKPAELAKIVALPDGSWIVADPEGRFDTNGLDDAKGLHWVLPEDPFNPLPAEVFMREYFEPRLLGRLAAGAPLPEVKALSSINRAQPGIEILDVRPAGPGTDDVAVRVRVGRGREALRQGGEPRETGVFDLRLFRDGQLVGLAPERGGEVALDASGQRVVTFPRVQIPRDQPGRTIEFSAYAFNVDRVRSRMARTSYRLPKGRAAARGRAFVVSVGVNAFEDPGLDLRFAVNDARALSSDVARKLTASGRYSEVVPVVLLSEKGGPTTATKANVRTVVDLLAGRPVAPEAVAAIPGAARLGRARPEDVVVISVSSHGYAGGSGEFYLVPSDVGPGASTAIRAGAGAKRLRHGEGEAVTMKDLLARCISSGELSEWLRDVDAGEVILVVDACQSAASVEAEGFKPGPMGSRGLGQLAYDKGMRVLAATQSDNVALENRSIERGLLTYALTREALETGQADFEPKDGRIAFSEWLSFAVWRVPGLFAEVRNGKVQSGPGDAPRILVYKAKPSDPEAPQAAPAPALKTQQPSLFDFSKRRRDSVLGPAPTARPVR